MKEKQTCEEKAGENKARECERGKGGEEKQTWLKGHLRRLAPQTSVLFGYARLADAMSAARYFLLVGTSVNKAYTMH
jgi:hypothetical protein